MSDRYSHRAGASVTPILAGAALVLAGYLVLDRVGFFDPGPRLEQRRVEPRGDLADFEKTTIKIFEENAPSAVHITTKHVATDALGREINSQGTGSGIIWDETGYVLTNHHVVTSETPARTEILVRLQNRETYVADFIFSYEYIDLAMIKIRNPPRNLRPALLGTSEDLRVGQSVFAIGNPFGLEQTLTTGIISALNRSIATRGDVELDGLIQVDAAINPGNSGGLLLDSSGRLIGMNTAIYSKTGESAGIGFAVPIDRIKPMVPRMMAKLPPIDAGLGITGRNLREPLGAELGYGYGVVVLSVVPKGGAAAAGIQPLTESGGDVIVRADGERIETLNGLYRILEKHAMGDRIEVVIARFAVGQRNYKVVKATVELKPLNDVAR